MKYIFLFLSLSLSSTPFSSAKSTAPENRSKKVRIALSPQCPYVCFKENDGKEGYIVDVLKDIFKTELELIFLPKLRLKSGLISGESDYIVLSSSDTILNARMITNSPALGMSLLGKVATSKKVLETPLYDLRDKSIVLPKDQVSQRLVSFYRNKYPKWKSNRINFITGNHQEKRMLKMLELKRADLILSDYYSLETLLEKEKTNYFLKPTSYTGFTPIILVGLDKKNRKVYQRISDWLNKNRKSGRIKNFLTKYNIEDWNIYNTRF